MPAMPRPKGLGKKLAYKILGKPANLRDKRSPKQQKVNKELTWQESMRVR